MDPLRPGSSTPPPSSTSLSPLLRREETTRTPPRDSLQPSSQEPLIPHKLSHFFDFASFPEHRSLMDGFLDNVFMQLDKEKFYELVGEVRKKLGTSADDQKFYTELQKEIRQAQPGFLGRLQNSLRSLKLLKRDLADQVATLMSDTKKVDGYVEIGYPGRMIRPIASKIEITGTKTIVLDTDESLGDYAQCGFPRPYQKYVKLSDDYSSLNRVPDASVDLVSCFIGMHHCPEDQLEKFAENLHRILRSGGSFILMDHDAKTSEMQEFASIIHTVFNIATGVPYEEDQQTHNTRLAKHEIAQDERHEIRNFQSCDYWTKFLEQHGFERARPPHGEILIRSGDTTQNTLLRFKKKADPIEQAKNLVRSNPELSKNYFRPQIQTYLTSPEWQNVTASEELALTVEQKSFATFSFFKNIRLFWNVFGNSWNAARKEASFKEVATSGHILMDLFIGVSMTVEYAFKGLFALAVRAITPKDHLNRPDPIQASIMKKYVDFIQHTPFYAFPYFSNIKEFWKGVRNDFQDQRKTSSFIGSFFSRRSVANVLNAFMMTLDFLGHGILSLPISFSYQSEALKEPETVKVMLKSRSTLDAIEGVKTFIVSEDEASGDKFYLLDIPRYKPFLEKLRKIAQVSDVECLELAGQPKIQCKLKVPVSTPVNHFAGAEELYRWPISTDPEHCYISVEVESKKLLEFIKRTDSTELVYIHDF